MHGSLHERAVRGARDQSLFRTVNEQMQTLNEPFTHVTRDSVFICECAHRECTEQVVLTLEEYERLRLVPTHFLVAADPGHVFDEIERITDRHDGYWVVEKFGEAGIVATQLDPRSRSRVRPEDE